MKICQKCNVSYDDDFAFCPKCGSSLATKIETMFCPYCGKKVESDVDFCPYCGKNLNTDLSYTNAPASNANSQHSDNSQNNKIHFDTSLLPTFDLSKGLNYTRNTPFIKWTIIVVIYVIALITGIFTEGLVRTFSMNAKYSALGLPTKGNITGGAVFLCLFVFTLIFAASWFILNKLHTKAAKILKYIILYCVVMRVLFMLFGGTYFVMIVLVSFLVMAYYSKKKQDD